jgi:capsular polysaccharide biosynthesis protein
VQEEQTIDLFEYYLILKRRWWLIVAMPIIFAIISAIVSLWVLPKVYEANTSLYVIVKQNVNQNNIAYNDLMAGQLLVKDYRELVKQRVVIDEVITSLNLGNIITQESLASLVNVSLKNDTRILEIKVKNTDPQLAASLADKVSEVFSQKAVEIMQVENVKIIDKAVIPVNPVSPKKSLNVAVAFFAGLLLAVGIVFLIEYLDDTIKNQEDAERFLGVPVIAAIPIVKENGGQKQ